MLSTGWRSATRCGALCAMCGLAVTGCGSGWANTSSSRGSAEVTQGSGSYRMSITFDQDYDLPKQPTWAPLPLDSPRTRTQEWFTYNDNGALMSLSSVTYDRDSGRRLMFTRWTDHDKSLTSFAARRCRISHIPLPTPPTKFDVVDDAIGPLSSPKSEGYTRKGSTFTKLVGPSRIVLIPGKSLQQRRLVTYDATTGKKVSTIDDISVGHESAPSIPGPTCSPVRNGMTSAPRSRGLR